MNDVIDINQLKKLATLEEWEKFAVSQYAMLEKYQRELEILRQKNAQLEHLLKQKTPSLVQHLVPEEIICVQQISFLEEQSAKRPLVLDEVKRLDLLVKNLKLIREESTIVINRSNDNIKEEDLVAIASGPSESDS